ncbi:hypothetical protein RRG08_022263 [Elysia crispata]|uniref:Paraoxonase n=1 Tax=Elysia crispata TaxID=231223 RepID=A0AAE1DK92_9GAST|nr:hypothetical protein RRG08_022263 [Elysia crispata]
MNYHFKKHYPGNCRQVSGIDFGSEDMDVSEDGLAFITSGFDFPPNSPYFHAYLVEKKIKGGIFLFDFKKPKLGARPINIRPSKNFDPETFQPHGINMLEDKVKGNHLLYVVNHVKEGKDRVEKFRFIPGSNELEHIRFFTDSAFCILNDVALTGEDQFYVSNYLYFHSYFLSLFEHLLPLSLGGLLFVDAENVTEVVKHLHGPNGVTLSKDKKFLYVAFPLKHSMQVYQTQSDNGLKLIQDIPEVHTSIDNFQFSSSGDALLAGAHPIPYKILLHNKDPHSKAPSSASIISVSSKRIP